MIRKGFCRYFLGKEGIGGMLYLTNQRLSFRPHPLHEHHHTPMDITLSAIAGASLPNKLRIFSQGILIALRDGRTLALTVWHRKKWQRDLERLRV